MGCGLVNVTPRLARFEGDDRNKVFKGMKPVALATKCSQTFVRSAYICEMNAQTRRDNP